jgi:tRNA threonylcarbamoyladenosine biosynthesis protein TsaE
MNFTSHSLPQTKRIAFYLLKKLELAKFPKATVIGLKGELGSGKTTFVRAVAELLKVKNHVTSPTFVIIKSYQLSNFVFSNLIHVDAYRIKNDKEIKILGWEDILKDRRNIIFIEWPENVKKALPKNRIEIFFDFIDQSTRVIKIKWPKNIIRKKV